MTRNEILSLNEQLERGLLTFEEYAALVPVEPVVTRDRTLEAVNRVARESWEKASQEQS